MYCSGKKGWQSMSMSMDGRTYPDNGVRAIKQSCLGNTTILYNYPCALTQLANLSHINQNNVVQNNNYGTAYGRHGIKCKYSPSERRKHHFYIIICTYYYFTSTLFYKNTRNSLKITNTVFFNLWKCKKIKNANCYKSLLILTYVTIRRKFRN